MKESIRPIRVRFAPSPTGHFHVGGARAALFNWLFARQGRGTFILRIEDTDEVRSKKEFEDEILESLRWLGLNWDEGPEVGGDYGPYRQSERVHIYKQHLENLLSEKKAYYCYCTPEELEAQKEAMTSQGFAPKYSGHCRSFAEAPEGRERQVIRFKSPEAKITFKDIVRGTVTFDASLFGDIVIAKDLEHPLYNFTAVVDDELMNISHVIRGEDHISNTPKQILLAKALGFQEPEFAHLPLLLNHDRSKMSKRYAETSLLKYREQGFFPAAIVNFLALLGWHPKGNEEVFTLDGLLAEFSLSRVQKAGAIFNEEKLLWLNKEHLKLMEAEEIKSMITPLLKARGISVRSEEFLLEIIEIQKERMRTISDFFDLSDFFFSLPAYSVDLLRWNNDGEEKTIEALHEVAEAIKKAENLDREEMERMLDSIMKKTGKGRVLGPGRGALSGKKASPDPFDILRILGKEESLERISLAKKKISGEQRLL